MSILLFAVLLQKVLLLLIVIYNYSLGINQYLYGYYLYFVGYRKQCVNVKGVVYVKSVYRLVIQLFNYLLNKYLLGQVLEIQRLIGDFFQFNFINFRG